jgi:hypothetical protein
MTNEQQLERLFADMRAEVTREWQRMQDRLSLEAARIEDRLAAHRQDIENRLANADARITFILDRLQVILASDGSDAEKLDEVENLRADFAASRTGESLFTVQPVRRIN